VNNINVPAPTSEWTDKDWNKFRNWLTGMLKVGEVTVTFTKKDGTERVMRCTLNPDNLPKIEIKEEKKERKKSEDSLAVYDIEAKGWRSFVFRSVRRVNIEL